MNGTYHRFDRHPDTRVKFKDKKIPSYDKVESLVKYLHRFLYNFKVVSWDVAIAANGEPVVIEYNLYNQSMDLQCNDGPLFGKYTDYVLSGIVVPASMVMLCSTLFSINRRVHYRHMMRHRSNNIGQ
jgi:hypothetical protein